MSRVLSVFARRLSSLALFLLLPLAAGCDGIFDPRYNDERDLERARDRWYATNAYEYEVTVDRRCDCLYTGPIRMLVRDGVPVAAVDRYSGAQVPLSVLRYYPSVEELFDLIDEAVFGRSVNNVNVSYDHSYGYPRVTYIDYDRLYTDDDITYELREFRLR
jgi:hypothetical protein